MKNFQLHLVLVISILLAADTEYLTAQNRPKQKQQCEEKFIKADTDKDGKISIIEFMAVTHPKGITPESMFKSKDTNGDGFLSREEFCTKSPGMGNRSGRRIN